MGAMGRQRRGAAPPRPSTPSTPASVSSSLPATLPGHVSSAAGDAIARHGRTALKVALVYALFKWVLPTRAARTPPGVDPKLVHAYADAQAQAAQGGCPDACKGMSCPAGWTTGRDKENVCKCICVRLTPESLTPWDEEQKSAATARAAAAAAARAGQQQQQMHGAEALGTGGAGGATGNAAATTVETVRDHIAADAAALRANEQPTEAGQGALPPDSGHANV